MSDALAAAREQTVRIARLNDMARSAMGVACTAVATVGFRSLPDADQSQVRELIESFDAFDEDNDPHGERDFGTIYQLGAGRPSAPECATTSANGCSGNSITTTVICSSATRMQQTLPSRGAS